MMLDVFRFAKLRYFLYFLEECIGFIIKIIDYIVPKDNRVLVFGSNGGKYCSGSPKALFKYIKTKHPEYKAFFYMPFNRKLSFLAKIKYILFFAPIFFKAKFLISSHPPTDFFPFIAWSNKKIFINMWHGTPMKNIFFADPKETKMNLRRITMLNKRTSVFIVSSKVEALLIIKCFRIDPKKILFSGHPRNDILISGKRTKKLSMSVTKIPDSSKIILYSPTYRRNKYVRFFPFTDLDLQHLARFLEENKLTILLRSHLYSKNTDVFSHASQRIIRFDFDVCQDINEILPEVDILITDYSSIYFDYLLLDRPCIFIPYDLDEYKKERGFLFDYGSITAGPKVLTYKQFIDALKELLSGIDRYKNKRKKLKEIFHRYQTENSCEKILHFIKNWEKNN